MLMPARSRPWQRPTPRPATTSRRPTNNQAVRSEPGRESPAGLVSLRLRLDLRYDGSAFHGWARQPGLTTVQQTVEEALWRALSLPAPPDLTVAGRTDAGVHARGQVGHVDVPAANWMAAQESAARRLSRILPPHVRVTSIGPAPQGFDARFSALWRRYSYRVCDNPALADPLRRHDTLWHRAALDLDRMNAAAAACLGEHDFAAFCRSRPGATTIRELLRLDWARAEPGVAIGTVVADAFCHNMVRSLTGALLSVGDGTRPPDWVGQVLAAGRREPAVRVASPHALCLEEVGYPEPAAMASRAAATRRVRTSQAGAGGD
jgi:tRNA pseudouridine38-40 synthase